MSARRMLHAARAEWRESSWPERAFVLVFGPLALFMVGVAVAVAAGWGQP